MVDEDTLRSEGALCDDDEDDDADCDVIAVLRERCEGASDWGQVPDTDDIVLETWVVGIDGRLVSGCSETKPCTFRWSAS